MVNYTVISPLKVCYYITKKGEERWFTLNLNQFRNAQPHMLGAVKIAYSELMKEKVKDLPKFTEPIKINYKVYVGSVHKSDVMNWVAVVDKFFQDVLVQEGKLIDDNYEYVPLISAEFGSIDKTNPRIEITIESFEDKPKKLPFTFG